MTSNASPEAPPRERAARFRELFDKIETEIGKAIVGQRPVVRQTLMTLLSGGHALLEGAPGLGKTFLVRSIGQALSLSFSRIQFTPDLMPADIIGTDLIVEDASGRKKFEFQPGPIFTQVLLADEINRATPKTQAALLEAMAEKSVTASGQTRKLGPPFFVLATQNPIEMEGTYPLPEAQLDRFLFKIITPYPSLDELTEISRRTTGSISSVVEPVIGHEELAAMQTLVREVALAPHIERYAARVILATHPENDNAPARVKRYNRYGASPRGMQALVLGAKTQALLDERLHVSFEDIASVAGAALRHRMILNFEGEAEGVSTDDLIKEALAATPKDATGI